MGIIEGYTQLTGNVSSHFPLPICRGCSHCDPVINTDDMDTFYDSVCVHMVTCSHKEDCEFVWNEKKTEPEPFIIEEDFIIGEESEG